MRASVLKSTGAIARISEKSSIAVFLGPSLEVERARALLQADYYPPARQGDIYRILPSGMRTIVLIDGIFHGAPSIWPRELQDAMEEGITVIGSSSMGAIRAAELHEFGMIGVGTIFRWYRDGVIEGDDEVALLHGPPEIGYRPLSEPLVNIRYALQRAVRDRMLTVDQQKQLIDFIRQHYYPDRTYQRLLDCQVFQGWSIRKRKQIQNYFQSHNFDIKKTDAIAALRVSKRMLKRRNSRVHPRLERGNWWEYRRGRQTGFFVNGKVITGLEILKEAYRDAERIQDRKRELIRQFFLLEWSRQNKINCPEDFVRMWLQRSKEYRTGRESQWLRANGLTKRLWLKLAGEQALLAWMIRRGPRSFGLQCGFVVEWGKQNGILPHGPKTDKEIENWILEKGPNYFGRSWLLETAVLQELQVTGRAADIAARLVKDE